MTTKSVCLPLKIILDVLDPSASEPELFINVREVLFVSVDFPHLCVSVSAELLL